MVKDVTVVPGEACLTQHKLIASRIKLNEVVKKRKEGFVSKCRVWKLKDAGVKSQFEEKVHAKAVARIKGDAESMWNELKDCLLEVSEETCGRTKGRPRRGETWWWNEDVASAINEKRRLFKIWRQSKLESDWRAYCLAKKVAGKAVYAAQEAERKKFGDMLEKEDRKGNVFKVVKRMVKRNRDVDGGGCIKDCNGDIVVEQEKLLNVWREYFDKLLNEEFE
jgi:hypothetical protein